MYLCIELLTKTHTPMTLKEMQQRVRLYRRDISQPNQHGDPIFENCVTLNWGYRMGIITSNVAAFNRVFFISDCGWRAKQRIPTLHNLTEKEAYQQLIDECLIEDLLRRTTHAQERRVEK